MRDAVICEPLRTALRRVLRDVPVHELARPWRDRLGGLIHEYGQVA